MKWNICKIFYVNTGQSLSGDIVNYYWQIKPNFIVQNVLKMFVTFVYIYRYNESHISFIYLSDLLIEFKNHCKSQ